MAFYKAYYSIVQFCPDRSRDEAANIGVIVICPELRYVDVRTSKGHDRVRRFFGSENFDPGLLALFKQGIETRVREKWSWNEGLADLEKLIQTRANDIRLTSPRSLKTESPAQDLDSLFAELVGGRTRRSPSTRVRKVFPELDSALRAPGVRERIRFDEVVNIPLLGKALKIPYAYQNGVLNLIKPEVFPANFDQALRKASELAVEGDLLRRHTFGKEQRLVVVPSIPAEIKERDESFEALFAEYSVRLVREDQLKQFIVEIETTAH